MTKFILHGGMLKYKTESNSSFFREFAKDFQDGDEVLFIGFARRDEANRLEIYERDKSLILAQTDKEVTVTNATHDDFIPQVKRAKAIFVTGGQTPDLVADIQQYPDFADAIEDKTFAGSSGGACMCTTYYFFGQQGRVLQGLGLLPIRLLVHYGNPEFNATDEALEQLKEYSDDLELVLLKECEWKVMEK